MSFLVCFCLFRFILPYVLEFYLSVLFLLVCWFDFFFLFLSFPFSSMMCGLWSLGSPPGGRTSELGDANSGCWTTRDLLTPWNVNQ